MIAYYFPPVGGSGAQRTVKFVKHLAQFGWESSVLSIDNPKHYEIDDKTFLKDVPVATKVYRSCQWNPYDIVKFPDKKTGWIFPAIMKGMSIIKHDNPNIIYSSSPPISAHLIALFLKKIFKLPWVADFRDPWYSSCSERDISKINRFAIASVEKLIIKCADVVIANTDRATADYLNRYKAIVDKIYVIPNGYDEADFQNIEEKKDEKNNKRMTISHVGEFYERSRNPNSFLRAVSELVSKDVSKRNEIQINFVGGGDYTKSSEFDSIIETNNLGSIVNCIDYVAHNESLGYLHSSDLLLLLVSKGGPFQVPAKTYEYLRCGRPILALSDDGASKDLLDKLNVTAVVDYDDIQGIKSELIRFYKDYKEGVLSKKIQYNGIDLFDRKKLTEKLVGVFEKILCRKNI